MPPWEHQICLSLLIILNLSKSDLMISLNRPTLMLAIVNSLSLVRNTVLCRFGR